MKAEMSTFLIGGFCDQEMVNSRRKDEATYTHKTAYIDPTQSTALFSLLALVLHF